MAFERVCKNAVVWMPNLLATFVLVGCGAALRPFPVQAPLWKDPDMRPFRPAPEENYSPFAWDAADQTIFRPISRFFAVDPAGEAINVNAMDEVPDSSWFVNRIGRVPMTPAQVERGPCGGPPLDPAGPWTVTGAKPNGDNPGFLIEDPLSRRYLLKFDGVEQPERATSADTIGSRVYHAAGYHAPCNTIVFFQPDILRMAPDAEAEDADGNDVPMTEQHIDKVLAKAYVRSDGLYRASASLFLEGRPLGPWRYQGTRSDDPNDVVNHEDRRELRGGYVLASWLNHFDTREQNTLSTWIEMAEDGRGYVRHNYIDFGDCFGSLWDYDGISRRLGHANYLDFPYLVEDVLTFGVITRPWEEARFGPAGRVLGYYDVRRFIPDHWKPGYPNPAFSRASERDNAWMARIVAHFTEAHIEAMVRAARLDNPIVDRELIRILKGRRAKILERWFRNLSSLTQPEVKTTEGHRQLCLRDLSTFAGVVPAATRRYAAHAWLGDALRPLPTPLPTTRDSHRVCVQLPAAAGSASSAATYTIVDVTADSPGRPPAGPARVHMYRRPDDSYMIVGLQRPEDREAPQP